MENSGLHWLQTIHDLAIPVRYTVHPGTQFKKQEC